MTDKIDEQDYRSFKQECEKAIQQLENELFKISSQAPKIDSLLKLAIENLLNLRQIFENADVTAKRKLINSIYPEKLVFSGDDSRTVRVNEVVRLKYAGVL